MASDTSLVFNLIGRDRVSNEIHKVERSFMGLRGTLLTFAPTLIPATAAVASMALTVGSTLAGAATSVGIFGLAVLPQIQTMKTAATAQTAYNTAVAKYGESSKQALAAQKYTNTLLADMPPATRQAAVGFGNLKTSFKTWSDSLASSTMPIFTKGFQALTNIIPTLTPIVKTAAKVIGDLVSKFADFTKTQKFRDFMAQVATWADNGLKTTVSWLEKIIKAVAGFVMSQNFKDFIAWGKQEAPVLVQALKNLATFMASFVKASTPLGTLQFNILGVLAGWLAKIPPSVLTPIAFGIAAISLSLKAYEGYTTIAPILRGIAFGFQSLAGAELEADAAAAANPLGAILVAVVLLGIGIAELVTHWKTVWGAIQKAAEAVWKWIKTNWPMILGFLAGPMGIAVVEIVKHWGTIKKGIEAAWKWIRTNILDPIGKFFTKTIPDAAKTLATKVVGAWNSIKSGAKTAWDWIKNHITSFVDFVKGIPGKITSASKGMFNGIKNAFKDAINWIIRAWNGLSFHIPGISVGPVHFGGFTLSTPNIPLLAKGGDITRGGNVIVGDAGPEMLSLPAGARVTPLSRSGGGEQRVVLELKSSGGRVDEMLIQILQQAIHSRGGDVQVVLGH